MTLRQKLLEGIDQSSTICAEIGALDKPTLDPSIPGVRFIDYTDSETLRQNHARNPEVNIEKIVSVSAIWGENTLLEALGQKVDCVVASHVIEHVPDLITWLREMHASLNAGGVVRLVVPDRRFTFDFLRKETKLSEVLCSHLVNARVPQALSVLDYCLNVTSVDCSQAWRGELDPTTLQHFYRIDDAIGLARDVLKNGTYHDVHCWVFTPNSFASLFKQLVENDLLHFECDWFVDSQENTIEFFVSLKPCSDKQRMLQSWQKMQDETQDRTAFAVGTPSETRMAVDRLRTEIDTLTATIKAKDQALADSTAQLTRIYGSRSWRITAPLRAIIRAIRG